MHWMDLLLHPVCPKHEYRALMTSIIVFKKFSVKFIQPYLAHFPYVFHMENVCVEQKFQCSAFSGLSPS